MMRPWAVDRGSPLPLIRQIYQEISSRILGGELRAGERLPSTRETAEELGVSRNVVMEAYEQLAAEGFLLGISGAGTFVAEGALHEAPSPASGDCQPPASDDCQPPPSALGRGPEEVSGIVDFRLGRPALDLAPYRAWSRIEHEARLASSPESLGSAPVAGLPELREALRDYLWRRRGIECGPERIVVTSGTLHGLALLSSLLLKPGSELLFEDPGHAAAREVFGARGARILPAPVDEEGICVELLPSEARPVLAFVTPSHQFPLGGCLSIQRRIGLVEWARKRGCLLVEGCVAWKRVTDRYGAPSPQMAMARFIGEGRLDRHIASMRKVYRRRRAALVHPVDDYAIVKGGSPGSRAGALAMGYSHLSEKEIGRGVAALAEALRFG